MRSSLRLASLLVLVCLAGGASVGTAAERPTADAPVASLEPAATAKLWKSLVSAQPGRRARAPRLPPAARCARSSMRRRTGCGWRRSSLRRPRRAPSTTFPFRRSSPTRRSSGASRPHASARSGRTSTRWRRSTSRPGAAGSRAPGSSWYAAGVTARQRMAEAGYDVARGDSWMLNELTTAVRRGDGNARANVRELLRGLYEGDGTRPTPGAVLSVGFGQRTTDVSVYQNTLQAWLADSAFWTDMATIRERLVAGGLRGPSRPRRPGRADGRPPRVPQRLPPARARPGNGRAAGDRDCTRVPAQRLQPARERGVAAGDRLGLDDGSGRADGRVPRRAGGRAPLLQRDDGTAA